MSDLGPAFGNPNLRAQVDKTRQNQAGRTYEDTWLDNFFQGVIGQEDIGAGVFDRRAGSDKRIAANEVGQMAGIGSDLLAPLKMAGLAALAAIPAMGLSVAAGGVKNAGKRAQLGAIRIGGAKDLVATHSFPSRHGPDIAKSGYLDAPSLGITSRTSNQYNLGNPQFVFRAGFADPEKQVGTLINRDGYFANPTGRHWLNDVYDPDQLQERIKEALASNKEKYNINDLRLGQLLPGDVGQTAAILSSPNFKTLKEFEKSPAGAATLRTNRGEVGVANALFTEKTANNMGLLPSADALVAKNFHRMEKGPLQHEASVQPSAMAEFKVLQDLQLNPQDAAVFVPTHLGVSKEMLENLEPLRRQGFNFFGTHDLLKPEDLAQANHYWPDLAIKRLPQVADSSGMLKVPRNSATVTSPDGSRSITATQEWQDFIAGKFAPAETKPVARASELAGADLAAALKAFGL